MRNLKTGAIQEKNFNASTKFDQANISKKAAQFSYEADNTFYFMDMETYDFKLFFKIKILFLYFGVL